MHGLEVSCGGGGLLGPGPEVREVAWPHAAPWGIWTLEAAASQPAVGLRESHFMSHRLNVSVTQRENSRARFGFFMPLKCWDVRCFKETRKASPISSAVHFVNYSFTAVSSSTLETGSVSFFQSSFNKSSRLAG